MPAHATIPLKPRRLTMRNMILAFALVQFICAQAGCGNAERIRKREKGKLSDILNPQGPGASIGKESALTSSKTARACRSFTRDLFSLFGHTTHAASSAGTEQVSQQERGRDELTSHKTMSLSSFTASNRPSGVLRTQIRAKVYRSSIGVRNDDDNPMDVTLTDTFRVAQLNPRLADDVFRFVPPKDAKEVHNRREGRDKD